MAEAKKSDKKVQKAVKDDAKEEIVETVEVEVTPEDPKTTAKAGKRSAKATREAEEKEVKEERKKATSDKKTAPQKAKTQKKPPRSRLERAGKKYREVSKQIEAGKTYNLVEAVDLATKTSTAKFDATVELHINLAVDPKQADQNVRDIVALPHGTGKSSKIAVFAEGDDIDKAKVAGADIVGGDDFLAALDKEQIEFDILISTPNLMPQLGKYAKLLGPKGLMPNPKSGTITTDVAKAVKEAKGGRVEFRVDQAGIIHLGIGKASFGPQKLLENAQAVVTSIRAAKPASVKGVYVKSAYVTTTMGPSVKTEL
ncbi:MAG TPA: 50S ribosomal protein L1 [Candidatus Saccharimonadales bacterium]|nr:50S ribosomal protein L1 [Candidatus Saccharimonadales bacterium]